MIRPRSLRPALLSLVGAVLLVAAAGTAGAQEFQWPDDPENLEVLPEDTDGQELRRVMGSFTDALGVRCSHCHVGEGDLSEYDFASDEKEEKEAARVMMRMVEEINGRHLAELDHDVGPRRVTCVTCHRGAEEPRLIQDVMAELIRRDGADSAAARYRQLRERYYGGFTYDFRTGPLSELAVRLADEGRTGAALEMARLEVEYHPEAYRAHFALARVQRAAGRPGEARASLERAIELAPNDRVRAFLRRQLEGSSGG